LFRGWRLTITCRELLLVSQWGFAQEFLLFITILIKLQSPILLPRRQRMGQSADFARWPWAVPTSRIIWRGSILRLLMKFNVSKYSEKFLCSFYWYCYVGLDDEAKCVLVEKQQNDSSHFPRWISVLERIVNFGTNRIPNTYSKVRIERTEYRVITRSKKTIRVVFEYLKLCK